MKYSDPLVLGYMSFKEAEIKAVVEAKNLFLVDMHMSGVCNLNCLTCYVNAGKPDPNELTFADCQNVLRQAKKLGARTWVVTGAGEPFMDKKFLPLIEFANNFGMSVVVFTNNILITPKLANWLFARKVSVVAKLNSLKLEVQDFIVGKSGASKVIYRGLNNLIAAGFNQSQPSRLAIDSVIVQQNYKEIPDIFRFCRDRNIIPYITTELPGGRGKDNAGILDLSVNKIRDVFQQLLEIDHGYGYNWEPHPPIVAGGSCKKILYQLFVGHTGEIGVCPGLNISLGNVRETSLAQALQSDLVRKVRHPEESCQSCPICKGKNKTCTGGCLLSKQNAGNLFGVDPQCCW